MVYFVGRSIGYSEVREGSFIVGVKAGSFGRRFKGDFFRVGVNREVWGF